MNKKVNKNILLYCLIFISIVSLACTITSITPAPSPQYPQTPTIEIPNTQIPESTITISPNIKIGIVNCQNLNLRSQNNENSEILFVLSYGNELKIVDDEINGWTPVEYNGYNGFVKSEYIDVK